MEPSLLSLLPPAVTIALAIVTKRIFLSLGTGIALGALLHTGWDPVEGLKVVGEVAWGLVIDEGAIAEEMYISAFVFLLGVMTAFIYASGGLRAFSEWALTKVRTRRQASLAPIVLGIVLFFDDAFSSLVGGSVSRPVTDQHRISRAKLSYLVDSTAAPDIILVPISGWAAFIVATMAGIFSNNNFSDYSGYEAYLRTIPAMYYPIAALLFVFAVAYFRLDFGPMRTHERRAIQEGVLFDDSRGKVPGETDEDMPTRDDGKVIDLALPVLTLIGATVLGAVWIGISRTDGAITPMQILTNTDVILALFYGGLLATAVAGVRLLIRRTPVGQVTKAALLGLRSMVTAVAVVFLAWMTAEIIDMLGIGEYVAGLIDGTLAIALLPVLLFLVASFISFAMGSTFGTFGLLLPIAAEIVLAVDAGLLIPAFGAVLAGAIFGDHASPLSDTTILSSIGSGIHLVDHVNTQLPYALVCSLACAVGYVVLGFTQNIVAGLLVMLAALGLLVAALRRIKPLEAPSAAEVREAAAVR